MKKFLTNNYPIICYVIISLFTELLGNLAIGFGLGINRPWLLFTLIGIGTSILFLIKNNIARFYTASSFLLIQGICCIFCIVLYEMTGTLFDFGMFNLRNDAMGILESIPLNFGFIFTYLTIFILFWIFGKRFLSKIDRPIKSRKHFYIPSVLLVVFMCLNVTTVTINNRKSSNSDYTTKLYADAEGNYKSLGMTANFVNELYRGLFFNEVELGDVDELQSFLYSDASNPTSNFGISEGNNVVTILVESLEWFSFVQDGSLYPNGHNGLTEDQLDYLFPNLRSFYNDSIVLNNFHAREKTDISENLSIIGSYPTNAYINYDFPNNEIPFSLPNILKVFDEDIVSTSYHNGFKNYYNRSKEHKSLGFDSFTGAEDLYKMGMTNWASKGHRNLDSEMIEAAKDEMFPTNSRFNTYIISITMHGMYYERENLKTWYEKIDSIDAIPESKDENHNNFRNYVAAVMEFDHALGLIIEDLTSKNLLDNTIITLFSDHNTYYQGLSNYVKDIYNYKNDNYTNLYRVPCLIRVPELEHQVIDKFTTTTDIVPTLLDLLGIKFYSNLYFGQSIFHETSSILYSRAYNIFLNEKVYFHSINKMLFQKSTLTNDDLISIESKAKTLLKKLEAIDKIFYHDFFSKDSYYQTFITNIKNINKS
ncbi:MAG: hypothetical protein E7184_03610 [Erysipelotrichaceae bacterium]|nr:hypothetical protein [Erysipelotrichaceae bacterium]